MEGRAEGGEARKGPFDWGEVISDGSLSSGNGKWQRQQQQQQQRR